MKTRQIFVGFFLSIDANLIAYIYFFTSLTCHKKFNYLKYSEL